MQDILRNHSSKGQVTKALLFALLLLLLVSSTMFLGNQGEVDEDLIRQIDPIVLLVGQGIFSVFMFIGVSFLFIRVVLRLPIREFFTKAPWTMIGLAALIAFSFMVVNSAVAEWNLNLDFPDSKFEDWAQNMEEKLKIGVDYLINFTSLTHFIVAFLVIGIIPAVGEELLFRGLIQNLFVRVFKNHHIAIWVTGLSFAAIHLQFYGVAPRMLLGVVFGYLYHWSGNLTVAMVAHFINNGLALVILYLGTLGTIEVTPEQMESAAPWPMILVFGVVCVISLRIFYQRFSNIDG